jgi:hypothetical protein
MFVKEGKGTPRATAICPECGASLDVTRSAATHLESLGMWEGIEDCFECSTILWFSVIKGSEGGVFIECKRF